jgi:hypothetical protein
MGRGPTFDRNALLAAYGAAEGRSLTAKIAAAAAAVGCSAGTMQRAVNGSGGVPAIAGDSRRPGKKPTFTPTMIETAWNAAVGPSKSSRLRAAAAALGCTPATVTRFLRRHSGVGRASSSPSGPAPIEARKTLILAVGHPATVENRTLFPTTVRDVGQEWLLKGGEHSGKIGRRVTKGAWKGFPIFTLTLEERATCPVSCALWHSCYGNHMPMARRWRHGPELLERHLALRAFGYTAHVEPSEDLIAYELAPHRDVGDRVEVAERVQADDEALGMVQLERGDLPAQPPLQLAGADGPGLLDAPRRSAVRGPVLQRSDQLAVHGHAGGAGPAAGRRRDLPGTMVSVGQEGGDLFVLRAVLGHDEESGFLAPLSTQNLKARFGKA